MPRELSTDRGTEVKIRTAIVLFEPCNRFKERPGRVENVMKSPTICELLCSSGTSIRPIRIRFTRLALKIPNLRPGRNLQGHGLNMTFSTAVLSAGGVRF